MKFLRIKGLIAFFVITAVIFGTWYLLVDGIVKKLIETGGTALVGAKVDLQKVDLALSPLGLTLTGLDITDPDKPMENMVHVDRIAFLMDFEYLLLGKVIVQEMSVNGVKAGTPRKKSGAIDKKERKKEKTKKAEKASSAAFSLPSLSVPNIDDILKKEKLESLESIDAMKANLERKKEAWEKKLKELPDDKKIDEYNKRIRVIKKGLKGKGLVVLNAVKDASELQKDIKKDLKNLKRAKKALNVDLKSIEKDLKALEKMPAKDLERLKRTYSLSSEGLGNFSKLLFGGKIAEWTDRLLNWYKKLEPSLQEMKTDEKKEKKNLRARGEDIKFREYKPQPDFLVKVAKVTLDIPAGLLKGEVKNISDNQPLIGKPTTLLFAGKNLKGLESAEIKGEINRLAPKKPFEKGSVITKGYKIKELVLSSGKDFPVQLKRAQMDGNLSFLHEKEVLNGDFKAHFKETDFESDTGKGSSHIVTLLLASLSDIKTFNLKGSLSGRDGDYDLRLSSDIDRVMKKAIGKRVDKESRRFINDLRKGIEKKVSGPLMDLKKQNGDLGDLDKVLAGNLKDLENQLKSSEKLEPKGFNLKF